MGDIGEYYQEQRERMRPIKEKALKDNTALFILHCEMYDFKYQQPSEFHLKILHDQNGWLNYWPSTRKASWDRKPKSFHIQDIEAYLMEHFKP
jgi:hypothetical protein